jgi:hypothetical protein
VVPKTTGVMNERIPHFSVDLGFGGLARGGITIEIGGFDPGPDGLGVAGPVVQVVDSLTHICNCN